MIRTQLVWVESSDLFDRAVDRLEGTPLVCNDTLRIAAIVRVDPLPNFGGFEPEAPMAALVTVECQEKGK